MEPIRRPSVGTNTAVSTAAVSASSAVVGFLLSPSRSSVPTVASNTKTAVVDHNINHRVQLQHYSSNVLQHHQYHPILVAPPLPPPPPSPPPPTLPIHPTETSPLLSTSPQQMLSATKATPGTVPQFHLHSGGSHHMATPTNIPVSGTPIVLPASNITTVGMALSPFGILPHERVVPHHTHPRHQHRKLPTFSQPSKTLVNPTNTSGAQLLTTSVVNPHRFFVEPTHLPIKVKHYDDIPQHQNKTKVGISDKILPAVSSSYVPHAYEQRYQLRNTPQPVGYLSVITRTAVTTTNGVVVDDTTNNNYYQAPQSLQLKNSDNHDRQYYNIDGTVITSQTPQQQSDNILLMGAPVQRGDPMHIVKNLQSLQTDIDCYGVKKLIEQQPKLLVSDPAKAIGSTSLLSNGSKCIIEHQHQHLQQLPKSSMIDPLLSYNNQYLNRRQPPPAHLHQHHNQSHLQQHLVTGNTKILPTPASLTVVSANGSTYLDVQQHQRHHRWTLDQQKLSSVSTSCFPGNISPSVFHQLSMQQHQQYSNGVSPFNIQPPSLSVRQQPQMPQSAHNGYTVSSVNPTYYSQSTNLVSPTVTSVTTSSSSPSSSYNRQQQNNDSLQNPNNFHDFANNLQGETYILNDDSKIPSLPQVIVPDIEQELSHLCDDNTPASSVVKPLNIIAQQPSFIDSYIKFINGGVGSSTAKTQVECFKNPKELLHPLSSSTPKPISKPYIPLPKTNILRTNEQISSCNGSSENKKTNNVTTTSDDDPRYFPLPKTSSSIAGISDDGSDGINGESSWLSPGDDKDQPWPSSTKSPSTATPLIAKNKVEVVNKKRKKKVPVRKKRINSNTATKKQKTQHVNQPRRQLSHRLAKEKTQKLLSCMNGEFDLDDDYGLLSDPDSDIDPAWNPSIDGNDVSKNSSLNSSRRNVNHKKSSKERSSNSGRTSPATTQSINHNNNNNPDDSTLAFPFKSGSFVALKSQFLGIKRATPQQIWRVDGKSLLQKFQRCNEDNVYKSLSTYTGWSSSHYNMYCQVAVDFVTTYNGKNITPKSSSTDMLVQIIHDEDKKSAQNDSIVNTEIDSTDHSLKPKIDDSNSTFVSDDHSVLLRTNFDVYIQTLASQALEGNFLEEIYQENDEFFLSNMRAIETVTQNLVQAVKSAITTNSVTDLTKVKNLYTMIARYPKMEICSVNEISVKSSQLHCLVCNCRGFGKKQQKFVEISLSGTEYNSQTLNNIEDQRLFSKIVPTKKVYCCSSTQCTDKLIILHNLEHLKFNIYKECCQRVATENEKSCNELTQDTTTVLNRLLADDEWIKKLFQMACNTWSRAKSFVSNRLSSSKGSSK